MCKFPLKVHLNSVNGTVYLQKFYLCSLSIDFQNNLIYLLSQMATISQKANWPAPYKLLLWQTPAQGGEMNTRDTQVLCPETQDTVGRRLEKTFCHGSKNFRHALVEIFFLIHSCYRNNPFLRICVDLSKYQMWVLAFNSTVQFLCF